MQLPKFYAGWYLFIFFAIFLPCFGVVIWYETGHVTSDGFLDTSFAIVERTGPIAVALALVLYLVMEALRMLSEIFLQQREERGRRKGQAQLIEKLEQELDLVETDEESRKNFREYLQKTREAIDTEQNGRG